MIVPSAIIERDLIVMQGKTEKLMIPGPVGSLEAVLTIPHNATQKLWVMCHPHPLQQGTMDNKVVTTLTRTFENLGFITLRFNYRGVGQSNGAYAQGLGEIEDTLAVVAYLRQRFPQATTLMMGGFSFGGFIAYQSAIQLHPAALVLVAPAIYQFTTSSNIDSRHEPNCPTLVIFGDQDDIISAESIQAWLKTRKNSYTAQEISGASHFFHGKLLELRALVQNFVNELIV